MFEMAQHLVKRAKSISFAAARASYRKWVQEMAEPTQHHRALFAMTKDKLPEAAQALALPGVAKFTQDPVE